MDMQKIKALLMSKTYKHRIEGLYHNGLISVEDVPLSVKRGWDRKNARGYKSVTSGHSKRLKRDKEVLNGFIDVFKESELETTYKGLPNSLNY